MDCSVKCGIVHQPISGLHYEISIIKSMLNQSVC